MVTNEMFNLLSGNVIRFGPIFGIFISVLLRVRSQIWDLECFKLRFKLCFRALVGAEPERDALSAVIYHNYALFST